MQIRIPLDNRSSNDIYHNIANALGSEIFNHKMIPVPAKIIVNKYSREHLNCLVPSMHCSAMIFEMIQSCTVYYQNIGRK